MSLFPTAVLADATPEELPDSLNFTAVGGDATLSLESYGVPGYTPELEYNLGAESGWCSFKVDDEDEDEDGVLILEGKTLFLRNTEEKDSLNPQYDPEDENYWYFAMDTDEGTVAAGGSIMSLLDPTCQSKAVGAYAFVNLFKYCEALTTAPALPATTLAEGCYNRMFYDCDALTHVQVAFTEWVDGATSYWLDDVASNGIFLCPAELSTWNRDGSHIPKRWKVAAAATVTLQIPRRAAADWNVCRIMQVSESYVPLCDCADAKRPTV